MRKTTRYILLITAIIFYIPELSAQVNSLYFMRGVPQVYQVNPAIQPDCDFFFGIPGVSPLDVHAGNSSFGLGDILTYNREIDSLITPFHPLGDKNAFLNLLRDRNTLEADLSTSILSFGFRTATETFFTFDIKERALVSASVPDDMLRFPIFGPDSALTYDFNGLGIDMSLFSEFSLGISQKIGERLTVGWRGKLLFGQANLNMRKFDFTVTSGEEKWPVHSNIILDAAIPFVDVAYDEKGMIDFDNTDVREDIDQHIPSYIMNSRNFGLAMDLGAEYKPLDWLKVSASLVDFGRIKWKDGVHNLTNTSDYEFLGIPVDVNDDDYIQTFVDSLDETFNNFSATENSYGTWLPAKFYAGAAFYIHPKISFGILSRTAFYKGDIRQQFTASANFYPIRLVSATFSYSVLDGTFRNVGAGLSLKTGPLNIYVISDTAPSVYFWPLDAQSINLKVGVNIMIGGKYKKAFDKPLVD